MFSVLTTIQAPTPSAIALIRSCRHFHMLVLVVGDRKSPEANWPTGSEFLSLMRQHRMESKLAQLLPVDHYSRRDGHLARFRRSEVPLGIGLWSSFPWPGKLSTP